MTSSGAGYKEAAITMGLLLSKGFSIQARKWGGNLIGFFELWHGSLPLLWCSARNAVCREHSRSCWADASGERDCSELCQVWGCTCCLLTHTFNLFIVGNAFLSYPFSCDGEKPLLVSWRVTHAQSLNPLSLLTCAHDAGST